MAPSGLAQQTVIGQSGASYTPDGTGCLSAAPGDVQGFLAAGFVLAGPSGSCPVTNPLRLIEAKNAVGTTIVSTGAASGNFTMTLTAGTSETLAGEAAQGNTKTDTALFELVLPTTYRGGNNLTVTFHASYACTGTAGTKTLAAHVYPVAATGASSADLVTTSAQTITTSDAAYSFTATGTSLLPGQRILVTGVAAMQETGGSSPCTAWINSGTAG